MPKVQFERYQGVNLGDFLIYHMDLPDYTSVPISYQLLDVSWDRMLSDPTTDMFRQHATPFCDEVIHVLLHSLMILSIVKFIDMQS